MDHPNNFVNPDYNEGTPDSGGNIVATYTVEESDTLDEIAQKHGLSIEVLLQANKENISDRNGLVQPGTRLMIPNTDVDSSSGRQH